MELHYMPGLATETEALKLQGRPGVTLHPHGVSHGLFVSKI
jgi:hypothetical protein